VHFLIARRVREQRPVAFFVFTVRIQNGFEAEPTKLGTAVYALDMVASSVLLDWRLARGTVFGIFSGPKQKQVVGVRIFLLPFLIFFTSGIRVPLFFTIETEREIAVGFGAAHQRRPTRRVSDHRSAAAFFGAPARGGVLSQSVIEHKSQITLKFIRWHRHLNLIRANQFFAVLGWAAQRGRAGALNGRDDVRAHANFAEEMFALQHENLRQLEILVKAHLASELLTVFVVVQ